MFTSEAPFARSFDAELILRSIDADYDDDYEASRAKSSVDF